MEFLSTGCEPLDKMLGGGIGRGEVALIYGEPRTGKTSLTIQCAFSCARRGLKVIFIDSDHTFSTYRLAQIAGNELNNVSPLILVFRPKSFQEQSLLIDDLANYSLHNISLVVVDTITALYCTELDTADKIFASNMKLNWQLAYLNELARTYNTSILLTSQVRTAVQEDTGREKIEPVASRVLKFWSQKIINLEVTSKPTIREATLEKGFEHREDGAHCFYMLDKSGIINVCHH